MSSLSRYEVLRPIGDNHFARFFQGYDTVGERDVCIIEFLEKFRRNQERWEQIWQQILSAGRIKHDYMVSVYDYDRDRGWVITELMSGSLRELPPESLKNSELVRTVLYRTLETLDYLHAHNHPHGDIRPANLLYDRAGYTKLSYSPGIALGGQIPRREKEFAFLAPELFDPSFGEVGIGVDLYGCGMSALSLLLGDDFSKKLIGRAVSDDVAWQRFHRDLSSHPSVRALLPTLPPDMEAVIQKLISKKVDQRFTSIAEARALLVRPEVEIKIQVQDIKPVEEKKRPAFAPLPSFMDSTSRDPRPQPAANKKPRPVRDWLNQKLKNPLVMGLVSACIVGMMMFGIALVSAIKERQKLVSVALSSKPTGATIYIDDKKMEGLTDAQLKVSKGAHNLKLELAGYQPATQKIEVPPGQATFQVPLMTLTPVVAATVKPTPPPEKKLELPIWKLPGGLEAVGSQVDSRTKLPTRIVSQKIQAGLQNGDVPLSFVLLPSGEFSFGAAEPLEPGELAARRVKIARPFYISEYELTQAQLGAYKKTLSATADSQPIPNELRNHPAGGVSITSAVELCRWLGANFEFPSEQEWEWAARGAEGRAYPWGSEEPSQGSVRMRLFNIKKPYAMVSVAELPEGKTPAGVHHLLGNAAEWCRDLYAPGYAEDAKTTGVARLHVIRGGSYRSPATGPIRITWRANAPDAGVNDVGVRIVYHPLPPASSKP